MADAPNTSGGAMNGALVYDGLNRQEDAMYPTMIEAYRAGVANGAAYASGLFPGEVRTTAEWARRYARGLRRNAGDRAYFLGLARGLRSHVWTGRYGIPD